MRTPDEIARILEEDMGAMTKDKSGEVIMVPHEQYEAIIKRHTSDGSTASYYELPKGCSELQDLISHRNMNAQIGEIFRACYRYGQASHSDRLRDAKKMKFYAEAEIRRLEKYGS